MHITSHYQQNLYRSKTTRFGCLSSFVSLCMWYVYTRKTSPPHHPHCRTVPGALKPRPKLKTLPRLQVARHGRGAPGTSGLVGKVYLRNV